MKPDNLPFDGTLVKMVLTLLKPWLIKLLEGVISGSGGGGSTPPPGAAAVGPTAEEHVDKFLAGL